MLEGIRNKLMKRYVKKNELIAAMEYSLGQKKMVRFEKEEDGASHYWCIYASYGIFKVECLGK
jgi:hypothetical protein